ncbi:hypothetical protein [Butyrivibrio proteoclasticus]|nr:hypothetical protein [Butyrivibrio proteoclasticus]
MAYEREMKMLIRLLQFRFRKPFSINGYSEGVLCTEKDGSKWDVYYGERNHKMDLHRFDSQCDAYQYLITQLTI